MRLLTLLIPLLPLLSVASASAPSTHYNTVTKTITTYTGTSKAHATPTQEHAGGGGADSGRTVVCLPTPCSHTSLTYPFQTSVEMAGGGGADSGRTITSVETAGGGGADSGRTITSVETAGGGGRDNGVLQATKTVTTTVTRALGAGAVITPVRWHGAAAGVVVGVLGML
jgi:hypothetical protein